MHLHVGKHAGYKDYICSLACSSDKEDMDMALFRVSYWEAIPLLHSNFPTWDLVLAVTY